MAGKNGNGKPIWDVFRSPKPGPLTSNAPGTGPYQANTKVDYKPGTVMPATEKPSADGYGGGADNVTITDDPDGITLHRAAMDALTRASLRMPGLAHMGPPAPLAPQPATFYDSLKTDRAWMYIDDAAVSGTITPLAGTGTTATAAVTMANTTTNSNINQLSRYPGAISMHLMVRTFGFAAIATTMTGAVYLYFVDNFGATQPVPLAILNSPNYNTDITNINTICVSPLVDAGATSLGQIVAQSFNVGTPVSCAWFVSFAFAYLIPVPAWQGYTTKQPHLIGQGLREPINVK